MMFSRRIHLASAFTFLLCILSLLSLLSLLTAPVCAELQITEFCPDGYASGDGDEYFIISGTGNPRGYSVSDGEGTVYFTGNEEMPILVARSASGFESVYGYPPDFEILETSPDVPNLETAGKFQMANSGDELSLLKDGVVVQTVSWPDEVLSSNGRVHVFEDGVWDKRVYKIGQSRFTPSTFTADKVTLFVSPDCSFEVISSLISGAKESISIAVYEFEHPILAKLVADATLRGVNVTVLVEGGPVGGMSSDEKGVLNYLTESGAHVYTIESVSGFPARYRYHHAKYMTVDNEAVAVLSENFGETGVPVHGTTGNRGWGAAVFDREVTDYLNRVFTADLCGYDIYPWEKTSDTLPNAEKGTATNIIFEPLTIENVRVTPVISPDTSFLVENMLRGASSTLDIEQAYISPYPDGEQNAWLSTALESNERGVTLRVILDGMYYNTQDDADNDELVARLNRMGSSVSAKLLLPDAYLMKLHNKGVIADTFSVLISSINWSYNSPTNNREAGLILDDARAGEYYTKVFNADFAGVSYDDPVSPKIGFDVRFVIAGVIILGLVVMLIIRRKF